MSNDALTVSPEQSDFRPVAFSRSCSFSEAGAAVTFHLCPSCESDCWDLQVSPGNWCDEHVFDSHPTHLDQVWIVQLWNVSPWMRHSRFATAVSAPVSTVAQGLLIFSCESGAMSGGGIVS